MQGVAPFLLMKAGGWSSSDMVDQRYGNLVPSDVMELSSRVDGLDWDTLD